MELKTLRSQFAVLWRSLSEEGKKKNMRLQSKEFWEVLEVDV